MRVLPVVAIVCVLLVASAAADDDDIDYYAILNLGEQREDSSEREIKSNWRRLSREHHPDLKGEESREHYKKIQRAYEVLSDRRKRKVYDMKGEEGLKQLEKAGAQQQQQPDDPMMRMFFGGGGGGDGAQRGPNIEMMMLITLDDAYNGAQHTVKLNKQRLCKACRGTGAASKSDYTKCNKCNGQGTVIQKVQLMPGFVQQVQQQCPKCGGKGRMVKNKCKTCRGNKVTRADQTLHVDIEQGTPENHKLVFDMEADQNPEQLPGDVIFNVQTAPHALFKRNGNDLAMTMKITLSEALLGFTKTFKHMDGHEVEVSESGVTQYGFKRRLSGEGMPVHNIPSERGKLVVTYEYELPATLTADQQRRISEVL